MKYIFPFSFHVIYFILRLYFTLCPFYLFNIPFYIFKLHIRRTTTDTRRILARGATMLGKNSRRKRTERNETGI